MTEKFQQLLENIKKDLIFLANEVEHNIRQAMKALQKHDLMLARQVIARDRDVDMMEIDIEDKILTLLALQQPVAIDLRFIIAGLKMNNDLERIGDHACNIARAVVDLAEIPLAIGGMREELEQMNDIACLMLHDAVSSFIHQDADLARDVCQRDNRVDQYYRNIVRNTIRQVKSDPDITHTVRLEHAFISVRIARFLERVGDLATNICEDVVFMKEATIIRHSGGEGQQIGGGD